MKKPQLQKNEYIDDDGNIKKKGFLAWVRNYGYYYKSYLIAIAAAVIFLIALDLSMGSVKPDLELYFVVENIIEEDDYDTLANTMYEYVKDVDSDGVVSLAPTMLEIKRKPETSAERSVYDEIDKAMEDDEIVMFIADEYGCEYLEEKGYLRELSFFGIKSRDTYRLDLADTILWDGVGETDSYYITMKYVDEEKYEDLILSSKTTMIVDLCNSVIKE